MDFTVWHTCDDINCINTQKLKENYSLPNTNKVAIPGLSIFLSTLSTATILLVDKLSCLFLPC